MVFWVSNSPISRYETSFKYLNTLVEVLGQNFAQVGGFMKEGRMTVKWVGGGLICWRLRPEMCKQESLDR